jgi:hypothetical protein
MPSSRVVAMPAIVGSVTIWLRRPEICSARPCAEISMASVTMNGTIRP